MLQRDGYGEAPIKRAVETFERLPENRRRSIAHGLEVVKWSVEGVEFDLSKGKLIHPLVPAKIAFEFLALCIGEAICAHDSPLPELRRILTTGIDWDDSILHVERLHTGDAARFMEYVMKRIPNVRRYRSDCSAALHTASDSPDCISEDRDTRTRTGWRPAMKT